MTGCGEGTGTAPGSTQPPRADIRCWTPDPMVGGRLLKAPRERKTSHLASKVSGQTQASTESEQEGSIGWGRFSVVHPLQFFPARTVYMETKPLAGNPFPVGAVKATWCVWDPSLSGASQSPRGELTWHLCCQRQSSSGPRGLQEG